MSLPDEVLVTVFALLQSEFDADGSRDYSSAPWSSSPLARLRLTCRRADALATPLLFSELSAGRAGKIPMPDRDSRVGRLFARYLKTLYFVEDEDEDEPLDLHLRYPLLETVGIRPAARSRIQHESLSALALLPRLRRLHVNDCIEVTADIWTPLYRLATMLIHLPIDFDDHE